MGDDDGGDGDDDGDGDEHEYDWVHQNVWQPTTQRLKAKSQEYKTSFPLLRYGVYGYLFYFFFFFVRENLCFQKMITNATPSSPKKKTAHKFHPRCKVTLTIIIYNSFLVLSRFS